MGRSMDTSMGTVRVIWDLLVRWLEKGIALLDMLYHTVA
jgi:hypothetical protein